MMMIDNTDLSVNITDPWNISTNNSQPTTSSSTTVKPIDHELSEFFGANASKISLSFCFIQLFLWFLIATSTSYDNPKQETSSNPSNIPSTTSNEISNSRLFCILSDIEQNYVILAYMIYSDGYYMGAYFDPTWGTWFPMN